MFNLCDYDGLLSITPTVHSLLFPFDLMSFDLTFRIINQRRKIFYEGIRFSTKLHNRRAKVVMIAHELVMGLVK